MKELSILVVDDDAAIADNISVLLHSLRRCWVDTACNGREAMQMMGSKQYDLVYLDISMPQLDGPSLLGELRVAGSESDTLIVMMTAHNDISFVSECIRYENVLGYLTKPFELDSFIRTLENVSEVIERREARRDRRIENLDRIRNELNGIWGLGRVLTERAIAGNQVKIGIYKHAIDESAEAILDTLKKLL